MPCRFTVERKWIVRMLLNAHLVVAFACSAVAQSNAFQPAPIDEGALNALRSKAESRYKSQLNTLPTAQKTALVKVYQQQWDNIKEKFDTKEIYTSAHAQQYLDALTAEIINNNPTLKNREIYCHFSRSGVPNASYIGQGIILFNMGLFQRLNNESQAAFVIAHELAHYYLKHNESSINRYVNALSSKETQKALHKIRNREYKQREDVEQLVKEITFDNRRHSRDHESEADSVAVEFLLATRFNANEALTTLALLDAIDTDTLPTATCIQQLFPSTDFPFKNKWLAKEAGLLGGHAVLEKQEALADSLKTHPDCKLRIAVLSKKIQAASSANNVIDKNRFDELRTTFRLELIEFAFVSKNYSRSLYYTLEQLQQNASDPFLITQIGRIFNGLYQAQKNHTLGQVAVLPAPQNPADYNLLLQFINNLYKEDFASLSYHYLNHFYPILHEQTSFKKEYDTSIQIAQQ